LYRGRARPPTTLGGTGRSGLTVSGCAHRKRPVTANGIMEAVNSLVQATKAKARGYRSIRNLKAIIYLIAGKLELALPT